MAGRQGRRGAGRPEDICPQQDDLCKRSGLTHEIKVPVSLELSLKTRTYALDMLRAMNMCCSVCRQPGQGAPAAYTKADLKANCPL